MALAALVRFAQATFEVPWDSTAELTENVAFDRVARDGSPPVPPTPIWIRRRKREDEVPYSGSHGWRIFAEVFTRHPDPDVERMGPDALGFYAPLHVYRRDWGIYIRDAGVKYLAARPLTRPHRAQAAARRRDAASESDPAIRCSAALTVPLGAARFA